MGSIFNLSRLVLYAFLCLYAFMCFCTYVHCFMLPKKGFLKLTNWLKRRVKSKMGNKLLQIEQTTIKKN